MNLKKKTVEQLKLLKQILQKRDFDWRGNGNCVTCSEGIKINTAGAHMGHFIHGKTKLTYYDPMNVHYQCRQCNFYGSHKSVRNYTVFIIREYGMGVLEELEKTSRDTRTWGKKLLRKEVGKLNEILRDN